MSGDTGGLKQAVRERVWALLEQQRVGRFPGTRGRIPNFKGAEEAARRLTELPEWRRARTIKANPDAPQLPVRAAALTDGKRLYMAVPRLAGKRPFLLLDPHELRTGPRRAASIRGASEHGRPVSVSEVDDLDLVVCGSVAVNRAGARIGKGGGYSDLELALLAEAGSITASTVVLTTVHPLQVLDEGLPETEHDFRLERIVTPDETIRCRGRRKRRSGVLWSHLDQSKVASIPALSELSED